MLNRIMVEWVNEWMHEYALFHLHQFNSTDHWCFSFLEDSFFKLFIDAFQSSLFIMHAVKPRGSRYIFIHSLDSNIWFTHDGMCELRGRKWICIAQILKMFPCRKQNGTWACTLTHTHTHLLWFTKRGVSEEGRFTSCLRHWALLPWPLGISLWAPPHRVYNPK